MKTFVKNLFIVLAACFFFVVIVSGSALAGQKVRVATFNCELLIKKQGPIKHLVQIPHEMLRSQLKKYIIHTFESSKKRR
ncbi:MAG: hypothetical protein ABIJ59_03350 [Pseudomonadota bacterium]